MGIGIVLLLWAVVGTVAACVGSLVMGGATALLTKRAALGRTRTIVAAAFFPFACLGWAALLFIFQAFVNSAMHRDPGLGDTWNCPLPDGYALMMIDTTDQGWVYNPKTQPGDGVAEQADAVSGVILAQVAGRYIFGGVDSHSFGKSDETKDNIDSYFLLDTQTGKRTNFSTQESMRAAATQFGVALNLEPIVAVYSRYRHTWFDILVGVLLCVPPCLYLLLLARQIAKVRKTRPAFA